MEANIDCVSVPFEWDAALVQMSICSCAPSSRQSQTTLLHPAFDSTATSINSRQRALLRERLTPPNILEIILALQNH